MAAAMIPPDHAPAFLAAHGWGGAEILPLAGDASFRRYFRIVGNGRRAVLMDAPPESEDSRPFLALSDYLRGHGFRAPELLAVDLDKGLILLEDFGDVLMRGAIEDRPAHEERIYAQAVDILASLHRVPPAATPPYDWAAYERELLLFTQWYLPAIGRPADEASYLAAWREAMAPLLAERADAVTVLRDYHAENLMLLANGDMGLLDFQDALAGHRAYDLVSLLQDARRDVAPALEATMIDRYCSVADIADRAAFEAAYALLGAQRNAKIVGIFTRLWQRDGKHRYLSLIPRVWALLERDLAHPALAPVARWMDDHLPVGERTVPHAG